MSFDVNLCQLILAMGTLSGSIAASGENMASCLQYSLPFRCFSCQYIFNWVCCLCFSTLLSGRLGFSLLFSSAFPAPTGVLEAGLLNGHWYRTSSFIAPLPTPKRDFVN
uniref:Secreted protein n=1 Tax=Opuntia streptacantha TaxID=393608 RepID=A0A7C8YWY0_OPUST